MRQFRFSLDTLHNLRREKELEREIELAIAVGELVKIDKSIEKTWRVVEEAFEHTAETMEALQSRERILIKAMNEREKLQQKRKTLVQNVENARQLYTSALSRRKSLDRLKEKRFEQWKKKAKRQEINFIDEVAKFGAKHEE